MKKLFILMLLIASAQLAVAQKVFTKTGHISFDATTPLEDIKADNYKAISVIDENSGQMEFAVDIKSFDFRRALMQEHFNENYMESNNYPRASFKGVIENFNDINLKKDGSYPVKVKGSLTIHNVTRDVEVPGMITVKSGHIIAAKSDFTVAPADYNISIAGPVRDKIAKTVKVSADMAYQLFK